jgi:hypothetical protein
MIVETVVDGEIKHLLIGLAESEAEKAKERLTLLSKRSSITRATDHIIEYIRTLFPDKNTDGSDVVTVTAEFPTNINQENLSNLPVPLVVVNVLLGRSYDANFGMILWADGKKVLKGFCQSVSIYIDVWAKTKMTANNLAGHISDYINIEGRTIYLLNRGFQRFDVEYSSRADVGFDFLRNYMYNPNFVNLPVFRHLVILRTKFDVVLQETPSGEGIITQIVLGGKDEFTWQDILGISMEYLYAEDIYLNWFDLGV